MLLRYPAVAGRFYPADPQQLQNQVDQLLRAAKTPHIAIPHAIVAPHAGYIYSGPIAASAYRHLDKLRQIINRVILLGPSHRYAFKGVALSPADAYLSPLGAILLDKTGTDSLAQSGLAEYSEATHNGEHSLEVHLPFLQRCLDHFTLVPLVAGDAPPSQVAAILEALDPNENTMIVVSTDLSHYHPYREARHLDAQSSAKIEALDFENLDAESACGKAPLSGLLLYARQHHWQVTTVDLRNSGDTAGDKQRVVGYGAYVLH